MKKISRQIQESFKYLFVYTLFVILSTLSIQGKDKVDSLLNLIQNTRGDEKADLYIQLANSYKNISPAQSIKFANLALDEIKEPTDRRRLDAMDIIGLVYYYKGELDSARDIYQLAFQLAKNNDSILQSKVNKEEAKSRKQNVAYLANILGVIYKKTSEYQEAIKYYQVCLNINEGIGDSIQIAYALLNIANVYYTFGIDYEKALVTYQKAYELLVTLKPDQAPLVLNNIALIYQKRKDYKKALEYLNRAFEMFKKDNNIWGLIQSESNLASVYIETGDFAKALKFNRDALRMCIEIQDNLTASVILKDQALIYFKMGRFTESINSYQEALEKMKQMNLKKETADVFRDLSDVYAHVNNFKEAYFAFKEYSTLKDSILGEDYLKQIQELEKKYESDKQKQKIEAQQAENRRQQFINYILSVFIVVILVFAFLLFKQFNEKKKANILLARQNDEITEQRDQIFHQKKEITDSIHYASRIQQAVLPPQHILSSYFSEYFVLFKPRDIVSGDFYWMNEKDNRVIFTASDCTGHGVPGAFMSMLGMAFLNEIVTKGEFENAADILNQLRNHVVNSLHQRGENSSQTKDGMDIALCIFDKEKRELHYSGAFNSMYLIRNGELIEGNADRMPIGVHELIGNLFTNHVFHLQPGNSVYVFTDGYEDQFGGEKGKKFMAKKFKQLLIDIQHNSLKDQQNILDRTIEKWRGEIDQIDDILVLGVRV